jgi:Rrf2 family protein
MIDVGLHCGEGLVPLKDIAERLEVSKKYLEHQTSRLEAAGLLRSRRGARGGMSLARSPSDITLSDIFQTLEGQIPLADCVESPDQCPRSDTCATRCIWSEMGQLMGNYLESKTLEDLCRQQQQMEPPEPAVHQ